MEPRSATKIICTIGPATDSKDQISALLHNGMSIARINLSHGNLEHHSEVIDNIRAVGKETGHRIFITLDTRGPEFRVGCTGTLNIVENELIKVVKKSSFNVESQNNSNIDHCLWVELDDFSGLEPGDTVTFDDNKLSVSVRNLNSNSITCKALNSHMLENNKRIHFPKGFSHRNFLGENDIKGLDFGAKKDVDLIFLSFVENADDVSSARIHLKDSSIKIISKIESEKSVKNIKEIIEVSDGIMVARGDLLNDIGIDTMFSTQKQLTGSCSSKPVIMATEMLSNMTHRPVPLRSEISDIGHAVLDGCSAVMLSEESACGEYPAEAVNVMRRICIDAEKLLGYGHDSVVSGCSLETLNLNQISFVSSGGDRKPCRNFIFQRGVYFK